MPKSIFLLLLLVSQALHFSCSDRPSTAKRVPPKEQLLYAEHLDTLRYTSGVRAIFQDSRGNYWFGSHEEGVCRFDGTSFRYFTIEDGLSHNQVRSIQEDAAGTIWFGTAEGVSSFNGVSIVNHTPLGNDEIQGNWKRTNNDLFFNAGNNSGVYRYDGSDLTYLPLPDPKDDDPGNNYLVTNFSRGQKGRLWISTYPGVFGYDGQDFTIITNKSLGLTTQTGVLHVRSILEDSQGRLWIGNNGIGVLVQEGDSTTNFSDKMKLIHPQSMRNGSKSPPGTLEHVFAIKESSNGDIWFADRDTGVWRYDGKAMTNYPIDDKLSSQMVWDIYETPDKSLLFATAAGGVYEFNGNSFDRRF